MRRSLLVSMMLSSFFASSAVSAACARNEFGVFEDINCAVQASAAADQELNLVYRTLSESLDQEGRRKLVAAQHAWLAFLSAQTKFVLTVEGDGSAGALVAINEKEELTRARVQELRLWLPR